MLLSPEISVILLWRKFLLIQLWIFWKNGDTFIHQKTIQTIFSLETLPLEYAAELNALISIEMERGVG